MKTPLDNSPPHTIEISLARADEVASLLALIQQFNRHEGITIADERIAPGLRRLVEDQSLGQILVARESDHVAGYAIMTFGFDLEYGGRDAWLTDLFIVEAFRDRGLGRLMLARVEAEARLADVQAIHLQVRFDNPRAIALYEKSGFDEIKRRTLSKFLEPLRPA